MEKLSMVYPVGRIEGSITGLLFENLETFDNIKKMDADYLKVLKSRKDANPEEIKWRSKFLNYLETHKDTVISKWVDLDLKEEFQGYKLDFIYKEIGRKGIVDEL